MFEHLRLYPQAILVSIFSVYSIGIVRVYFHSDYFLRDQYKMGESINTTPNKKTNHAYLDSVLVFFGSDQYFHVTFVSYFLK